jgi:hypothetical protein
MRRAVPRRTSIALALAAAALALVAAVPAGAAQTTTQRFFTERLLADEDTSREVRDLLQTRAGFVARNVQFRDLTGDRKADAVVRVDSGGAAGVVAVYVLSTDTGRRRGPLEVVFGSQELLQAETRIRDGVLRYRSARPQPGDEVCCPSRLAESRLRWRERQHRFDVVERREVNPTDPWGDELG